MQPESFLDLIEAPDIDGLALGITAARALERYSRLVEKSASSLAQQRIDVADELLDVVLRDTSQSAGYVFTGISLAEWWDALNCDQNQHQSLPIWRDFLHCDELEQLRKCARQRATVLGSSHYLRQMVLALSRNHPDAAEASTELTEARYMPQQLQRVFRSISRQKAKQARYRGVIALVQTRTFDALKFALQGPDLTINRQGNSYSWVYWSAVRLLPLIRSDGRGLAKNYFELQLTLPNWEDSYFSDHFKVRNCFAHLRCSYHIDLQGRKVMLLDEVQSDWVNDLRKQQQGKQYPHTIPPLPNEAFWLEIAMEFFLKFSREQMKVDIIALTPGRIVHQLQHELPLRIAERLYDQQVPAALKKQLLRWRKVIHTPVLIHSYNRNVMLVYRNDTKWTLFDSCTLDNQIFSGVENESDALQRYLQHASKTIEHLPGYDIRTLPDSAEEPKQDTRFHTTG